VGTEIGGPGLHRGLQLAGRSGLDQSQGFGRILFSIFRLVFFFFSIFYLAVKSRKLVNGPKLRML
jgi:hypothetical protein